MLVCGVDEAGRGPAIGPLVIAGVSIERRHLSRLARAGVRDSKLLSPARREDLYGKIIEIAHDYETSVIRPRVIDSHVRRHGLNIIEARHMARVILRLSPRMAYVDACDPDASRFGRRVTSMLDESCTTVIKAHHGADSRFVVVSAASIIAKVTRDRVIARIQKKHGVGSGYPSDPRCVAFLRKHARSNDVPPPFARASWATVRRIYGPPPIASVRRQERDRGRRAQALSTPRRQTRL